MLRKCLCDGNNDNDHGDDDDVTIYFSKTFEGIMIYIEVTKFRKCFKKTFCFNLPCRKFL